MHVHLPKSWSGMMNEETILTSLLTSTKFYAPIVFLSLLAATIPPLGRSLRAYTNCHYHAVLF